MGVFEENYNFENFYDYLDAVRIDYENQSLILSKKMKHYSYCRVVLSCSIPVVIVVFEKNQLIPIAISSLLALIDFLLSFNKLPDKLHKIDDAINKITYEYNLFTEKLGEYANLEEKNAEKIFKEKMIEIIYKTDSNVTNKYNIDNIQDVGNNKI